MPLNPAQKYKKKNLNLMQTVKRATENGTKQLASASMSADPAGRVPPASPGTRGLRWRRGPHHNVSGWRESFTLLGSVGRGRTIKVRRNYIPGEYKRPTVGARRDRRFHTTRPLQRRPQEGQEGRLLLSTSVDSLPKYMGVPPVYVAGRGVNRHHEVPPTSSMHLGSEPLLCVP